ncbi:MAG: hypothetical protein Q7T38_13010 [Gallionella sp.]|nr:hypothetical protein [Gallionella sp.]
MNTNKNEMRAGDKREDLGKGLRGKYADRVAKDSNLALLKNLCLLHKTLPQTDSVIDTLREDARY